MKLYRYYNTKQDLELLKNHVWFDTDIHDAAYYASNGVVMEYDIDPDKLKLVEDKYLDRLDDYGSLAFPNQQLIDSFKDKGFNAYGYEWEDKVGGSFLIFDKTIVPEPKILTNDNVTVKYHSFRRVVNIGKSYVIGPQSLLDRWCKTAPSLLLNDNTYSLFVKDEIFFNASQKDFEDYVRPFIKNT